MSDVNNKQVGGDHYRSKVQHWDYVELNGLGYLEGCATKYATRGRKKHLYSRWVRLAALLIGLKLPNPAEDLQKARHYVEKLMALHFEGVKRPRIVVRLRYSVEEFAEANGLTSDEAQVVRLLTFWQDSGDLDEALQLIDKLAREARG